MKTKPLFLASMFAFCGMLMFGPVSASNEPSANTPAAEPSPVLNKKLTVAIGMTGVESGSVTVYISNNGKGYSFVGSHSGFIGEFTLEGDSFDIELAFSSVSPSFSCLTTSANFNVTRISDTKYHVTVYDEWLEFGEIGLHFGNF